MLIVDFLLLVPVPVHVLVLSRPTERVQNYMLLIWWRG